MQQVNDVRKAKREVFRRFIQNSSRLNVAPLQRSREMPGLATAGIADEFGQKTVGIGSSKLADFAIHRPTGAALFDDRAVAVEPHVADLPLARGGPVINSSIHDQPPADAAAEREVKDRIEPDARSVHGFT